MNFRALNGCAIVQYWQKVKLFYRFANCPDEEEFVLLQIPRLVEFANRVSKVTFVSSAQNNQHANKLNDLNFCFEIKMKRYSNFHDLDLFWHTHSLIIMTYEFHWLFWNQNFEFSRQNRRFWVFSTNFKIFFWGKSRPKNDEFVLLYWH